MRKRQAGSRDQGGRNGFESKGGTLMPQSVYKVIEIIGTSPKSWEEAAKNAVELTGEHLRDLRVAEVVAQDLVLTRRETDSIHCSGSRARRHRAVSAEFRAASLC